MCVCVFAVFRKKEGLLGCGLAMIVSVGQIVAVTSTHSDRARPLG